MDDKNLVHNLKYEPKVVPPVLLWYGTIADNVQSIYEKGLLKDKRQHVHLSPDKETAIKASGCQDKPVLIPVNSLGMYEAGHKFALSPNGVWLTDHVPPQFIGTAEYPWY